MREGKPLGVGANRQEKGGGFFAPAMKKVQVGKISHGAWKSGV